MDTEVTIGNISGWSLHCSTRAPVYSANSVADTRQRLTTGDFIPRGGGQSFGDVSLPDNGAALSIAPEFEISRYSLDAKNGVLNCPAGMTQRQVLERTVPLGWVLPAIPGSSDVTIGGAVAADAHGKNHYYHGSIADHIQSLEIMVASGEVFSASREKFADLFWATIGGLGLTGVVLEATFKLQSLASAYVIQEITPFHNTEEMLDIMEAKKNVFQFLLGTVDGGFSKGHQWHGVITSGTMLGRKNYDHTVLYPSRRSLRVPGIIRHAGLSSLATWSLNKAISLSTRHIRKGKTDLDKFFFPQDSLANWNMLFGKTGFVDYQCCIPIGNCKAFFGALHMFLNHHAMRCFLVAVKRFRRPTNENPLVFAQDGISIALDMPIKPGTKGKLNELDDLVIKYGGRVNLVKDCRLSRSRFDIMYPRKDEWLVTKNKYDPNGRFRSQLSSRLGLNST